MTPGYMNTVQGPTQLYEVKSAIMIMSDPPAPAQPVAQNKWKYVVEPTSLQVISAGTAPVKSGSAEPTFLTAWNTYETENTDLSVMGLAVAGLPGDFELKPIPVGAVVPGWYYNGGDQLTVFLAWPNQGEC